MQNETKIVKVTENGDYGFQMFVDGEFMWYCETLQDVYDQIEHSKDCGFFDENTIINF